jgi:hypothetical protein
MLRPTPPCGSIEKQQMLMHTCTEGRLLCGPGSLQELVSACEVEGGEDKRALARNTALATMTARMHALSPAERQNALCARGAHDLTPLAQACDAGEASTVSHLLSLGAARSIFVRGFLPQELLCTIPYSPVEPERHISPKGRALAEQRRAFSKVRSMVTLEVNVLGH